MVDVITVGMKDELLENGLYLIDLSYLTEEEGVASIVGYIYEMSYRELMSRTLLSVWDWELRTKHMFEHNNLHYIGDIVYLSQGKVNRLIGCGYKTRKEIYDIFYMYHLKLNNWSPDKHWDKANYKFKEDGG